MSPFHLAIPVRDVDEARAFYGGLLGCPAGRSADTWADFDFFGHQLVCHFDPRLAAEGKTSPCHNPVDGHQVPVPHFGVVLEMPEWEAMAARLREAGVRFVIEPYIRFRGEVGEQATLFFLDPSGNAIEIKAFKDVAGQLFAV